MLRALSLLLLLGCSTPRAPAETSKPAEDCVKACERRNMARAVSAEMIRAECEQECAAEGRR